MANSVIDLKAERRKRAKVELREVFCKDPLGIHGDVTDVVFRGEQACLLDQILADASAAELHRHGIRVVSEDENKALERFLEVEHGIPPISGL